MKHGNLLTVLILIGLAGGALFGQFVLFGHMGEDPNAHWTKQAGDLLLIRPLFLLIIPLVFVSVVVGMTSIGDPSKLGVVGSSTVLYYLVTMLIACTIGAVLVTTFRPGDLADDVRTELRGKAEIEYADSSISRNIETAQDHGQSRIGFTDVGQLAEVRRPGAGRLSGQRPSLLVRGACRDFLRAHQRRTGRESALSTQGGRDQHEL